MSRKLSTKLLSPTVMSSIRRAYSTDRPYSTVANLADIFEEDGIFEKTVENVDTVRPYSEIPGPKELPILGNSWRFAPLIGKLFKKRNF